jgi:subtilisin family serine protease
MGAKLNDPLLKLQWGLRRVGASNAWHIESGKKADVKVAVVDTGVDATHEDLAKRVLPGFDFVEMDEDTYDDNGHGTHVAGVIAANASNKVGIAGLSMGATIIPEKVCEAIGTCPIFGIYAGTIDAVVRGASILNLSLGGAGACSEIDQAVFDWVREQGVLTVVAAGNSAEDKNPTINPANCDNTLAVGAIDDRDRRAIFSSYGDFVDIAAPGVGIWSTVPPLVSLFSGHIGYASYQGTSMASPHVAGAAALLVARHPDWTPEQLEERLLSSAADAGKKGRDDFFGHGILNIFAALR